MSWLPNLPRTLLAGFAALLVFVLPASAADVKLLKSGTGEKVALRFSPKPGATETMKMVMDMDMVMDMGAMGALPQTLPTMTMVMDMTVDSIEGDDIHYSFVLTEASAAKDGVDPMMLELMEAELAKMVGIKGKSVVTTRGITKSVDITPPEGTATGDMAQFDNMKKSMGHASAPFPVEPVGVGAQWVVTTDGKENGVQMRQELNYTIVEMKGSIVTLDVTLNQMADKQPMNPAGLPPGTTATLESFDSNGTGKSVLDTTHIVPTSGTVKHNINSRLGVKVGENGMNMGMQMKLGLQITRE